MTIRQVQFKAETSTTAPGLGPGQFEAIVAVFGNKDTYGDIITKGAFTDTLKAWEQRPGNLPVIWSHDWTDPFSHVGTVVKAEETDQGLRIVGEISEEEQELNPKAAQVYRLLKAQRVTQFSFAYDVVDGGEVEHDGQPAYELRKLDLLEVGPCLVGVNRETELLGVKAETRDALERALAKALLEEEPAGTDHRNNGGGGDQQPDPTIDIAGDGDQQPDPDQTTPAAAPGGGQGTTDPGAPAPPRTAEQDRAPEGEMDPAIALAEIDITEIESTGEHDE